MIFNIEKSEKKSQQTKSSRILNQDQNNQEQIESDDRELGGNDFNERSSDEELRGNPDDDLYFNYKGKPYQLNPQTFNMMTSHDMNSNRNQQSMRMQWMMNNSNGFPQMQPPQLIPQFSQNMRSTDQSFFSTRNSRKNSKSREGSNVPPMMQNYNQQMFPILPTVIQIGSYYEPSHPFQNQPIYYNMNQIYKQQSVPYPTQYQPSQDQQKFYSSLQRNQANELNKIHANQDVHLAYLFASPLMLETSEGVYFDCLPPISFKEEFESILKALEPENINFKYRYMVANDANLRECLNDSPVGLHFAGHGFINNEKLFRTDKRAMLQYRNKGDILIFENDYGSSQLYSEKDLQELLEITYRHLQLEFVVVSSCHSECVGKIFQKAGAKHVICIDQEKLLQDEAAIHFSRIFYCCVFGSNFSICEAFESAKGHIKKILGVTESDKYKLLKSSDHPKNCRRNDIRRKLQSGPIQYKGITPKVLKLPTKVTPFISRNQDMFDVIRYLKDTNIVHVFGLPGLGKSSLIKNVANFIGERNLFRDGVLYINFQNNKTFQEALANFMQNFEDNLDPNFQMKEVQLQFNQSFRKQEKQKLLKQIYKHFKRFKKSFLLVLDNLDDINKEQQSELSNLMMNIVQESANAIKVLFSSSFFYEQLENYKVKKLRGLSKTDSVELFMSKIPLQDDELQKFFDWDKIMELHQYSLEKLGQQNLHIKMCKCKTVRMHTFKCIKEYLIQHPLFEILAGQPLSLSMIAPLSLKYTLKEIYQQLVELPILDVFKGRIKEDALIVSLEVCLKILNDTQEKAVELFYLIGITKEGLFEEDFDQLFEEEDTKQKLLSLIELSLIQYESLEKAGAQRRFKISTFLDKYVEQKLTQQSKRDLNMFLATYYASKLKQLKKDYANNNDQQILVNGLQKYEKNILYCMKQLFDLDYNTQMPKRKNSNLSGAPSPKSGRGNNNRLVDKNMLNVGNATLKMQNNTNHLSTPITIRKVIRKTPKAQNEELTENNLNSDLDFQTAMEEQKYHSLEKKKSIRENNFSGNEKSSTENSFAVMRFDTANAIQEHKKQIQIKKSQLSSIQRSQIRSKNPSIDARADENLLSVNTTINKINDDQLSNLSDNSDASIAGGIDSPVKIKLRESSSKVRSSDKRLYDRQLRKLSKLGKQNINKERFDQLVKSLTIRMGNSQTDEFDKLFKKGGLNFQQPLAEQLAQLSIYEQLCFHYISILALIDHRQDEVGQLIFQGEFSNDQHDLQIPQSNKLLIANLKMVYIYTLITQNKYDAVNGENLELYSLFQDINCPLGEGISLYLKAKYLQKMKRKTAFAKAEKYIIKSSQRFEIAIEPSGIEQCIRLLQKINSEHQMIYILTQKMEEIQKVNEKEIQEKQEEFIDLTKHKQRDESQDKIKNMLLNIIQYSFLKKQKKASPTIQSVKEQGLISNIGANQRLNNALNIQVEKNNDFMNGINQKPVRGLQTPQIIPKKAINLAYQPRQGFEQDQDQLF